MGMKFSQLLSQLSEGGESSLRNLAQDPELTTGASLDQADAGQLSFIEPGHVFGAGLETSRASALLLPASGPEAEDLQRLASDRRIAWLAVRDPRLAFAEALAALHPPRPLVPGIDPSAVVAPSARIAPEAEVGARVVIGAGSVIHGGCVLHPGAVLYDDVELGEGSEVHANAVIHPRTRVGRQCVVQSNAVIGAEGFGFVPTDSGWVKMPQTGHVVLEDGVEVGCGSTVDRPTVGETRIGAGTKIDNLVHVGHGVVTGRGCALAAQVGIAGGARLGDGVILAGQVGVANRAVIGDRAIASSKSGIHGEVAAGEIVSGYPAIPNRLWLRCSAAFNKLPEMARTLRRLQK